MAQIIRSMMPGSKSRSGVWSSLKQIWGAWTTPVDTEDRSYSHPREEPDDRSYLKVRLGDRFDNERFTVLRKLGYGQYSTVWLANDAARLKHVALKILRSDCYGGHHDIFELQMLKRIVEVSKSSQHAGQHHVSRLVHDFEHVGPHGRHVCMAFDVLGQHLGFQVARSERGRLPLRQTKQLASQLLLALDFLHGECGIIHTDLQPSNILVRLPDPEGAVVRYLESSSPRIDDTAGEESTQRSPLPLRETIPTPDLAEMNDVKIVLTDLGVASWTTQHLSDYIQPPILRAPEVMLGAPWGSPVDIWSLGCLMVEFVQGFYLFKGHPAKSGVWSADDDRLAQMIEVLGPFPESLLKRGTRVAKYFDEKGNLKRISELKPKSLESLIDVDEEDGGRPDDMPPHELSIFVDFLKGMLAIDPSKRKSAAELSQHPWLHV